MRVSAKHIRSISLLRLSSRMVYLGIYMGSKGSWWLTKLGELGRRTKSVPLLKLKAIYTFWRCSREHAIPTCSSGLARPSSSRLDTAYSVPPLLLVANVEVAIDAVEELVELLPIY
jgi:hypothetical protein